MSTLRINGNSKSYHISVVYLVYVVHLVATQLDHPVTYTCGGTCFLLVPLEQRKYASRTTWNSGMSIGADLHMYMRRMRNV